MYRKAILNRRWTNLRGSPSNGPKTTSVNQQSGELVTLEFISNGKMHDVRILDHLVPEPGAFYVMDRGYVDFERLGRLDDAGSFFVTRAKSNMKARRRYSRPVDRSTGLICDQTIVLTG